MKEIKYRFRLELIVEKWGTYKKGDIDTFIIPLLSEKNGLIRFGIDKQWKVVSFNRFTGLLDKNKNEIYEGDIELNDWVIKWDELLLAFICIDENQSVFYFLSELYKDYDGSFEIKSNIYTE